MSKARILIVEDDINLLEGVRTVLELESYDVLTAENGEQALEVLRTHITKPPHLIVSDIMMPRMDGIQLLNQVRVQPEWVGIPFIFLTARSEKSDVIRGKRLGVDDYLVKPFDADDLLIAIESRLKRHAALKEVQSEEITDLKKKILTILNHEFRTPLTFLVAYTDMLNEQQVGIPEESDAAIFLRGINVGAMRLRRLIENFIYLVEMETGDAKRIFEMRKVPLANLGEILDGVRQLAFEHYPDRVCEVRVDPALPTIIGDPVYLTVAIHQLLDNAIKFSQPEQPISLSAMQRGNTIVIAVKDSGRGIDQTEQNRIWETFYQINRAVYEDQGAGSGLPIVRGVARLHGGDVSVESERGQGSTFMITIPVAGVRETAELRRATE